MPQTPHRTYEEGVSDRTARNWKAIRDDEKRHGVREGKFPGPLRSDSRIPEAAARVGYPDGPDRAGGRVGKRTKSRSGRRR